MQTLNDTTTAIDLEQLVNGDDCKCESTHSAPGATICTITVVARKLTCDIPTFNICQGSLNYNRRVISNPNKLCPGCGLPLFMCWRILPI